MDKKELISSMWKIVLNQITDADFVIGYGFDNNEKLWKVYQNNERGWIPLLAKNFFTGFNML